MDQAEPKVAPDLNQTVAIQPGRLQIKRRPPHEHSLNLPGHDIRPQEREPWDHDAILPAQGSRRIYGLVKPSLPAKEECPDCEIEGECYADGETHPENVCLVCDILNSTTEWTDNDDAECDDELFCNGYDFCLAGACSEHENPPCPNDGLWCNGAEVCNEVNDTCTHENAPDCSDDGLWCNGKETCNEDVDQCVHEFAEGGRCPSDLLWCNGEEVCDEDVDQCIRRNVPDCTEDDLWCNGETYCNEDRQECDVQNVPECIDDGRWCNGEEFCDEEADQCASTGNPCDPDEECNESRDECLVEGDSASPDVDTQDDSFKTDDGGGGCCGCGC
jgi:hypothetical protein